MDNKRKQLIITPPIQYKFLGLIVLSLTLPAIILSFWTFSILENIIMLTGDSSDVVQAAISASMKQIIVGLIIGFSFIAMMLFYWSMIFSNRIVGPLYRLEKSLDTIIENEFQGKIAFRKNDEFSAIAEKVNTVLKELQTRK